MDLTVQRSVDPKTLTLTVHLNDAEVAAAIDGADPEDLAFKLWLVPVADFAKAEYVGLVAELMAKIEQAASLGLRAGAPEFKEK